MIDPPPSIVLYDTAWTVAVIRLAPNLFYALMKIQPPYRRVEYVWLSLLAIAQYRWFTNPRYIVASSRCICINSFKDVGCPVHDGPA